MFFFDCSFLRSDSVLLQSIQDIKKAEGAYPPSFVIVHISLLQGSRAGVFAPEEPGVNLPGFAANRTPRIQAPVRSVVETGRIIEKERLSVTVASTTQGETENGRVFLNGLQDDTDRKVVLEARAISRTPCIEKFRRSEYLLTSAP